MRFLQSLAIAAAMVCLAACSTVSNAVSPPADLSSSLQQLNAFTVADLQNADTIAQAQNPTDAIGHQCFSGLIAFVQAQQTAGGPAQTVSGAFSALEAGRAAVSNVNNLISKAKIQQLELACAPLLIDTQNQAALFVASLAALGVKP